MRRNSRRLTLKLSSETIRLLEPPGLHAVRGANNVSGQYPSQCEPTLAPTACVACAPASAACVSAGDCDTMAARCTTK
jgi:hypothetical protein